MLKWEKKMKKWMTNPFLRYVWTCILSRGAVMTHVLSAGVLFSCWTPFQFSLTTELYSRLLFHSLFWSPWSDFIPVCCVQWVLSWTISLFGTWCFTQQYCCIHCIHCIMLVLLWFFWESIHSLDLCLLNNGVAEVTE